MVPNARQGLAIALEVCKILVMLWLADGAVGRDEGGY